MVLTGIGFLILFYTLIKAGFGCNKTTITLLFFSILLIFMGAYNGSLLVKGITSEKEVFEGNTYTVNKVITYRSKNSYQLNINDKKSSKRIEMKIDSSTYTNLKFNEPDIKVTYYPYINVIDKIEYK